MLRRPIAGIYTMSNLMSFEPYVDRTISFFFTQLDERFVQTGDVCELGTWLQMFAFDVMGELTFSKRLGFLEKAEDVDGIMGSIWRYFQKTTPVSLDWLSLRSLVETRVLKAKWTGHADPLGGPLLGQEPHLPTSKGRSHEPHRRIRARAHRRT